MSSFPVFFCLEGRPCLVVGGGPVGLRKARALHEAGARVTVVSPEFAEPPVPGDRLCRVRRPFAPQDAEGKTLVFACTGDSEVQEAVASAARAAGVPVCRSDSAEDSDFHGAAVLRRGELSVAVGTGGRSPSAAALVRRVLEQFLGPEYAEVVTSVEQLKAEPGFAELPAEARLQRMHDALARCASADATGAADRTSVAVATDATGGEEPSWRT